MTPNLETTLKTAEKRRGELIAEYDSCLHRKAVSSDALQLTHDICGLLCSVLDRTARRYWEVHVAPSLTAEDRDKADIYFPVVTNTAGLNSTLGRWRWKAVREQHQAVYDYMLSVQPFMNPANNWLSVIKDLAIQGKHIDFVPQTKTEERRITVTGPGGGMVSWNPAGVKFSGNGIFINGARVDPTTQRIVPTPGVKETVDVWVGFVIQGHGVNAAGLCNEACSGVRKIATDMTAKFGLS